MDIFGGHFSANPHHRQIKARVVPLTDKALLGDPPLPDFTSWLSPSLLILQHPGLLKSQVCSHSTSALAVSST